MRILTYECSCDRCGRTAVNEVNPKPLNNDLDLKLPEDWVEVSKTICGGLTSVNYILCSKCFNDFMDFVKGGKSND